jgi:hypothetical protein
MIRYIILFDLEAQKANTIKKQGNIHYQYSPIRS